MPILLVACTSKKTVLSKPFLNVSQVTDPLIYFINPLSLDDNGFDECQVDKSGRYLVIKFEDELNQRLYAHIDLETGATGYFEFANGAYGHSDCGYASVVGQSAFDPYAMTCMRYDFAPIIERGSENYWQNFTIAYRSVGKKYERK